MLSRRAALWLACAALAGCGPHPTASAPGQALASVDGVEITVLQLNDELARANVDAASEEAASKQLLQGLIDRQLLQGEAAREKVDRDPKVMQALDRARALIVAQAYLQKRVGNVARPSDADVDAYYRQHPAFFQNRKQFVMDQLQLSAAAITPALKAQVDGGRTLEDVARWLDARGVAHGRSHVTRSSADLAAPLVQQLVAMKKGQLFAVSEGARGMVIALTDVQDAPIALEAARGQIAQFLVKQAQKDAANAELARLRAKAKITYLNAALAQPATAAAQPAAAATDTGAALARGVAGLK